MRGRPHASCHDRFGSRQARVPDHGIDATEKVVVRKQLRRSQVKAFFEALAPCLIGMEACATAHYWARELTKLGDEVRLMPARM
jgi:transposase